METKPETKQIYEALSAIMLEITHIGKTKTNTQQNFKYRGIDDIMNELHSLFAKNSVIILPLVKDIKQDERQTKSGGVLIYTKLTVQYDFIASDGSFVSTVAIGEAMDSGDKSTNKAMSVALKYVLLQMFLIPTEDMTDPDATTHEVKPKEQPKDEMSDIAKRLGAGLAELRDCKYLPDLARVWSKYKDLQVQETFKLCKDNMKKNIQKNNPNGASSSAI
jgi:hypothetical protein